MIKSSINFIYNIICHFLTFRVTEAASAESPAEARGWSRAGDLGQKVAMFFFWSAIILSPLQIFIFKVGGKYLPISYLCALGLIPFIPAAIANARKEKFILIYGGIFASLIFFQLLSLFWSVSVIKGVSEILRELPFLSILLFAGCRWDWIKRSFDKRLAALTLIMVVCALLIIVFRLFPDIELSFLKSGLAGIFINPKSLRIIYTDCNSLDPAKAGGLFLNANTGAMHAALFFWIIVNRILYRSSKLYLVSIVILSAAIGLSGSKATFLLMLAAFILMLIIKCRPVLFASLAVLLCVLFFVNNPYVQLPVRDKAVCSWTGGDRLKLYKLSFKLLAESPVFGLGFGGWEKAFTKEKKNFAFRSIVPPHNAYLFSYLQSGIIAFLLSISLPILFFIMLCYRFIHDKGNFYLIISLGAGVGIVLVQSIVGNYLWSDLRIVPLLALAIVLLNKPEGIYDSAK